MKERVLFFFSCSTHTTSDLRILSHFWKDTSNPRDANMSVSLLFLYIPTLRATSYLPSSFTAPNCFFFKASNYTTDRLNITFYFLMKILCRPYSPYCTFSFFSPRSQLLFFFFFLLQMNSFFFSFPPSFFIFPSLPAATPARTWLVLLRSTSFHARTLMSHLRTTTACILSLCFYNSSTHTRNTRSFGYDSVVKAEY
ncbi:unnamed protein product [Acanthosepion pharaonis]|uniref:Uncharacterized protein n=1 Tax=Acanthosepion pharaonis TaxID=158019 RepID=A0A812DX90_ACAPH|nr:unnamed protein product [Sepia pharaonis]